MLIRTTPAIVALYVLTVLFLPVGDAYADPGSKFAPDLTHMSEDGGETWAEASCSSDSNTVTYDGEDWEYDAGTGLYHGASSGDTLTPDSPGYATRSDGTTSWTVVFIPTN